MHAVGQGGIAAAVAQMAFGNGIGFDIDADFAVQELFNLRYGALLVETDSETAAAWVKRDQVSLVGKTADAANISVAGVKIALSDLQDAWEKPLNQIFPIKDKDGQATPNCPCLRPMVLAVAKALALLASSSCLPGDELRIRLGCCL